MAVPLRQFRGEGETAAISHDEGCLGIIKNVVIPHSRMRRRQGHIKPSCLQHTHSRGHHRSLLIEQERDWSLSALTHSQNGSCYKICSPIQRIPSQHQLFRLKSNSVKILSYIMLKT